MKNRITKLLVSAGLCLTGAQAHAKLWNGGIYVNNQKTVPGSLVKLTGTIYSDADQSGVTVTLGLHRVDNGVVADTPTAKKYILNQKFSAGQRINYDALYNMPSNLKSGTFVMVMKAGTAPGNSDYLLVQNPKDYPVTFVNNLGATPTPTPKPTATPVPVATATPIPVATGTPVPVATATPQPVATPVVSNGDLLNGLANSGVYVENTSVGAGGSVRIHNSLAASQALSGVTVQMEIHSASTGAVVSAAQGESAVNFAAGENKVYIYNYALPSTLASGQYYLAVHALNSAGQAYVNLNVSAGYNTFSVVAVADAAPVDSGSADVSGTSLSSDSYLRGINIMDAAIGSHAVPGTFNTNYTTPTLESYQNLKARGLGVIRLPIMWERMQKSLGGSLDADYSSVILQSLRDANTAGLKIILDVHNYARYTSGGVEFMFGQSGGPTQSEFADFWAKLSKAIRADSAAYNAIYAYDLMNEPHDLETVNGVTGNKIWELYAQSAVTGIRATGDTKMIHINGYNWASPLYFANYHPAKFIVDPANNIMYQAHLYMDDNGGGIYTSSFAYETAQAKAQGHDSVAARAIYRLKQFTNWCAAQQVRCFVGEYGWPNASTVGTAEANLWNQAGELTLQFMDNVRIGATMWATGSWLNPTDNILNTYTLSGRAQGFVFMPLSQAPVLEAHPGK